MMNYCICEQYGEVLGQGNGGKVLAGVHKATRIPVAIKVSSAYHRLEL